MKSKLMQTGRGSRVEGRGPDLSPLSTLDSRPSTWADLRPQPIERPTFIVTPLKDGLAWRGDGTHRFEEKMDGVTAIREITGPGFTATLWGEWVKVPSAGCQVSGEEPDTSHLTPGTSVFYAVDVLTYNSEDLRAWPRRESLKVLDSIVPMGKVSGAGCQVSGSEHGFPQPDTSHLILRTPFGLGGEFLEAVIANGGEGVVASLLDEPFSAPRWKCKRMETFIAVVLEKHSGGKSSVRIEVSGAECQVSGSSPDTSHLTPRTSSWLPLFGRKFDKVRVGSVLKVEGYGLTAAGKIREPRVCKDTPGSWLVRY